MTPASQFCSTPSFIPHFNDTKLPNPFLLNNGQRVRTKNDWACRRRQISSLIQGYEAGSLPPRPHRLSGSFSRSNTTANLTITAGLSAENEITFTPTISYPSGNAPKGGWPLIIGYGGPSIPIPDGVGLITEVT